jgi:hypothetical protein
MFGSGIYRIYMAMSMIAMVLSIGCTVMSTIAIPTSMSRVCGRPPAGGSLATQAADFRHVGAVGADRLAPLAPGGSRLVGGKFVGLATFVRSPPALAGDLSLAF